MHFSLCLLRIGISLHFIKLDSEKYLLSCLGEWWSPIQAREKFNSPALQAHETCSSPQEHGREEWKGRKKWWEGWMGTQEMCTLLVNSLVKPLEIYSWKEPQKRSPLLIKAFMAFLWNAIRQRLLSQSCKGAGPWPSLPPALLFNHAFSSFHLALCSSLWNVFVAHVLNNVTCLKAAKGTTRGCPQCAELVRHAHVGTCYMAWVSLLGHTMPRWPSTARTASCSRCWAQHWATSSACLQGMLITGNVRGTGGP